MICRDEAKTRQPPVFSVLAPLFLAGCRLNQAVWLDTGNVVLRGAGVYQVFVVYVTALDFRSGY